jgi:hypothetical protein
VWTSVFFFCALSRRLKKSLRDHTNNVAAARENEAAEGKGLAQRVWTREAPARGAWRLASWCAPAATTCAVRPARWRGALRLHTAQRVRRRVGGRGTTGAAGCCTQRVRI